MKRAVIAALLAGVLNGWTQGSFVNLDFESPIPPLLPDQFSDVPIANAIPGWTAYTGGFQRGQVHYNAINLDGADVCFMGVGAPLQFQPIAGNYSVLLKAAYNPNNVPELMIGAAIAQTGQIPANAKSLVFLTGPAYSLQAFFSGSPIPLVQLGAAANSVALGADISAFAGQIGELRLVAPPSGGGLLDNIQFSTQPIPEPAVAGLSALGAVLLSLLWHKRARV